MKKPYKQHRLLKIKNINNSFKNRYKIRYSLFGIKYTVKNKTKLEFFKRQKEEAVVKRYNERKKQLEELKEYRKDKNYILTCYVITYNQANVIKKCLNSLIEQETKYPYLIKILEDASTDKTFDICLEYAKKYPDKIELNTLCHNSKGKMLTIAYEDIKTKYFCRIDGDDYWCNENKIETALDFLESHPDYVSYAHDTAIQYMDKKRTRKSNIHDLERNKNVTDEISFDNFFYVHVSSRVHRNVLDFKNKYKNVRKRDRILWCLLLDAGKAYYDDRIMAVYTQGKGDHNGQYSVFKLISMRLIAYKMNKFFKYKYDKCFELQCVDSRLKKIKYVFGKKLGWEIYIWIVNYFDIFIFIIKCTFELLKKVKLQNYNVNRYTGDFIKEDLIDIAKAREEFI